MWFLIGVSLYVLKASSHDSDELIYIYTERFQIENFLGNNISPKALFFYPFSFLPNKNSFKTKKGEVEILLKGRKGDEKMVLNSQIQ